MRQSISTIISVCLLAAVSNQSQLKAVDCYTEIDPYYRTVDIPSLIHISIPQDAERIRQEVIDYFWPEGFPSAGMPASVEHLSKSTGDLWPRPDDISLPTAGLVGHWKFDGDTRDSSGSNDALTHGPVTVGADNGVIGGAARFAGGDYLTLPVTAPAGDWTVMCWVKPEAGNVGMFLASGYDYYNDGGRGWEAMFVRYYAGGNTITGAIDWPGWHDLGRDGHMAETPITPSRWHHVAVTYDDRTHDWKYYVDAILADTGNTVFPGWSGNTITLGGSAGVQGLLYDYVGLLDDMRLYNRVVQAEEITIRNRIPDWIGSLGSENLKAVDRLDIAMDYDMHSYVYHLHPTNSINRLLIYQMGHTNDILTAGGRETIKYFLDKGYSIMTFWMPLFGENTTTAHNVPGYGSYTFSPASATGHDAMSGVIGESGGSFIRFFIEPVVVAVNYAESSFGYRDVNMAGVSGGGWATHVCAAVDPRIKLSFAVAGALPLYLRRGPCPNGSEGDAEQEWPPLFEQRASWLDIYILAGFGQGRGHVHILNQYDPCCFWGVNYRTFEPFVTDAVRQLGQGFYYVFLDSSHHEHRISEKAIVEVIDRQLSSCGLTNEGDANLSDLDGDGMTGTDDLIFFADRWLQDRCPEDNWCGLADIDRSTHVDMADFAIFLKSWMSCEPGPPDVCAPVIPLVATGKAAYSPNEPIGVNFQNASGDSRDWIGLYRAGAPNALFIVWRRTGGQAGAVGGIVDGGVTFTDGLPEIGYYEVRMFFHDSYNLEALSQFTIAPPG